MVALRVQQLAPDIHETSLSIVAADGHGLGATRFEPAVKRRKLVVINGATGVPHRFYHHFARYLAEANFDVITYDYRGIGASRAEPLRAMTATMADWGVRDVEAVLRYAIEVLSYSSVDVIGHSIGGQLVGFAQSSHVIDRIVGVAAQLGDYRLWPTPASRWREAAMVHVVIPAIVRTFGYLPGKLMGEPLPGGVALELARWCATPGYFTSELSAVERERYAHHAGRILAYSFEQDRFAPPAAVDAWAALFAEAAVRRRHIDDAALGHFGFFKHATGAALWEEVREFLAQA